MGRHLSEYSRSVAFAVSNVFLWGVILAVCCGLWTRLFRIIAGW